uniref:TRAF1-6 MATH domain-containing protein n=1 Tax=Macrostomum lignano TaxID=282301 RepID=A0A1I8FEF2_9PLAT
NGDNDRCLAWPFAYKITFHLIDQCEDVAARRNIVYVVSPNTCKERPTIPRPSALARENASFRGGSIRRTEVIGTLGLHQRRHHLPEHYRRRFESGDKFSTVVAFVREAVSNASSSRRRRQALSGHAEPQPVPLTAFSKEESEWQRPVHYRGFDRSVRSVLSIANLFNYIYQLANRPFEAWFRVINEADGYNALWYSVASSIVASDSRVFGCYVVLLNGSSVSIAGPRAPTCWSPGSNGWGGSRAIKLPSGLPASEPADEDEGPDIPAAVYFRPAAAAGTPAAEDGGLGGQVKVVTEAEASGTRPCLCAVWGAGCSLLRCALPQRPAPLAGCERLDSAGVSTSTELE